jgi:hypothetical protein
LTDPKRGSFAITKIGEMSSNQSILGKAFPISGDGHPELSAAQLGQV